MLAYSFIVLPAVALYLIGLMLNVALNRLALLSFAFVMIAFSGVRYNVGIDYKSYMGLIDGVLQGSSWHFEPGFILMIKGIGLLVSRPDHVAFAVFFVCSAITVSLFYKFALDCSPDPVLSFALFALLPVFYLSSFNAIRSFLAIAIFAYSLKYVFSSSLFSYLIMIFLATMFHKTAVLLFPMYWFLRIKPKPLYYLLIGLIVYIFANSVLLFEGIYSLVGLSSIYIAESKPSSSVSALSLAVFPLFGFFLLVLWRQRFDARVGLALNLWYASVLLVLLQFILPNIDPKLFYRLTGYFTISILMILPLIVMMFKKTERIFLEISFVLIGSLYFVLTIYINGVRYNLVPYETIF